MLLDCNRYRPASLVGISETVKRAHAGIADPGEDELIGTTHADELIVDEVGRHPDESEMAPSLANDLVPGREGNEMGKPFHGDCVAVAQGRFHRFGETEETRHGGISDTAALPVRLWPLIH